MKDNGKVSKQRVPHSWISEASIMAREINLFVNNWKATGKNISVPQYSVDVTLNWIDNDGEAHTRSETLKFPNFLSNVGVADLKEWLTELMTREARQRLGVN